MKKLFAVILSFMSIMASAQTKIYLSASGATISATLADNSATAALVTMLSSGPVTVNMEEYGGFEMVGALPHSLPASDRQITTGPGDIMLYQGRNIVIFFGSNSWSYTPLGKVDDATADKIRDFFTSDNVSLTISLQPYSGMDEIAINESAESEIYDLNGRRVESPAASGIYVINGKKVKITR